MKLKGLLLASILLVLGCKDKTLGPEQVCLQFILDCEAGKMTEASKLLASSNNVDYFKKYQHLGKNMLFIDYDYKGNDDVLEIQSTELSNDDQTAVVRLKFTYHQLQNTEFSKSIILHNEGSKEQPLWRIWQYPGLYPVKVKEAN